MHLAAVFGLAVTCRGMRLIGGNSKGYFVKQCLILKYAVLILRSSVCGVFFHIVNKFFQPFSAGLIAVILCFLIPSIVFCHNSVFLAVGVSASVWPYHFLNLSILDVGTSVFQKCSDISCLYRHGDSMPQQQEHMKISSPEI